MTLAEILAAVTEYVGGDKAKVKEVAQGLRDNADTKPIAQMLLNAGAGRKKGEVEAEVKPLQEEVRKLTEERDSLLEQLETAAAKPTEQQAVWDRDRKKLTEAKERAEKERDDERAGRAGDAVEMSVTRFLGQLKGRVDDFGLDALHRRYRERFRTAKAAESGGLRVEVLDAEGDPIEPPKGKTVEEVLADEAFEAVPAANRIRSANAGGGAGNGSPPTQKVSREELEERKAATGQYRL